MCSTFRWVALATAVLLVSACAANSTGEAQRWEQSDLITAVDIAADPTLAGRSAFEVVERVRPRMLQTRGHTSTRAAQDQFPGVGGGAGGSETGGASGVSLAVYVDGARAGGVEALRRVPAERIESIRRLSAADATTLYGTGHSTGALVVTTRP